MAESREGRKSQVTAAHLLDYFMGLYKLSLGVPRDTDSKIIYIEPSRQYPKLSTYELLVEYHEEPTSRRVTIGPIGEESGSQSACFFAIYDSKLVIKIPPKPITDFEEYIHCIERDRRIVAALSPRTCLIPGVSMILDKIYKFPRINELRGNAREDAYFEWLKFNQEYQRHLKIAGGFVFFMDLSQHMFLADVFSFFHGLGTQVQDEMTRDPSILDSFEKFEGRYGVENIQVGIDLKGVYKKYDEQVRQLLPKADVASSDMMYKMQHWFFSFIGAESLGVEARDLDQSQQAGLNLLLKRIVEEDREAIEGYREVVVDFLRAKRLFQNRNHKEGVVANILELLAWLQIKGVAVRDIKPDNLLVAGDMNNYPAFLATPDRFSIGLIDFETTVVYRSETPGEIEQPFLGGTSWYATPLHMFTNKILQAFYKDMSRAFYLQDWFSTVAMIYRIIAGDHLFPKTSRLFMTAAGKLREAKKTNRPVAEAVVEINGMFWKSAVTEFNSRLEKKKEILSFLKVSLPGTARQMLADELVAENERLEGEIKTLIDSQNLFKTRQTRDQLHVVTPDQLGYLIKKAEDGAVTMAPSLEKSLAQLRRIQKLKSAILKNRETLFRIGIDPTEMTVYDLMTFMFTRVVTFMDIRSSTAV